MATAQIMVNFEYAEQLSPDGLAQAFIIGEEFIGEDPACLVLGITFYGHGFPRMLRSAVKEAEENNNATVFVTVKDPERWSGGV